MQTNTNRTKRSAYRFLCRALCCAYLCSAAVLASTAWSTDVSAESLPQVSAARSKPKATKLKSFRGAKVLVIGPKKKSAKKQFGVTASSKGTENVLFYTTAAGIMKEVTYLDEKGKPIKITYPPVAVYNANDQYFFVGYGYDAINIYDGYLVRKSDGKMYPMGKIGYPKKLPNYFQNVPVIQADGKGNIFYAVSRCTGMCSDSVVRVATSRPTKLSAVTLTPTDESIYGFSVNQAGHVLYSGRFQDYVGNVFRVRKLTSGFENMPGSLQTPTFWVGYDEAFYYYDSSKRMVYKVLIDDAESVTRSEYAPGTGYDIEPPHTPMSAFIFTFADRTVIASPYFKRVVEVNNPSATIRSISTLGLETIRSAAQSQMHYFIAGTTSSGQGTLLKVDPATDAAVPLVTPGTYSFYSIEVGADETVTFNALRMSDGAKVIGTISPSGVETLISQYNFVAVDIEPIN